MSYTFQEWAFRKNKDIFGFESERLKKQAEPQDDNPYDPIDSEIIIKELLRCPPLGIKESKLTLKNHIIWGEHSPSSFLVDISPLGSYKMIGRRKLLDLEGTETWICKTVIPLTEHDTADRNEVELAHGAYEEFKQLDRTEDSANPEFDLENLALHIAWRVKREHPEVMIYDRIYRMNDNHYIITLNYRGQGVEAPGSTKCEQFHINLCFYPSRGLARIWANEIQSPRSGATWSSSPSEFDEYFAPSQSREEIEEAFMKALSTY